ncbi:TIGR00282 family metallophosphoesterase [Spiroplasma endosymbiont of Amphibalanus improvisus]|uniref:TIGR00282 family metallophosphoesterase n=1 Tax=Spiroplasma endosymbiont of Amphibalanus improvisus TaxID=3066327 RepID=UPI00313D516B
MNVLMVGDIFAKNGRTIFEKMLPKIKEKYKIDFIIANGENISHGKSISYNHFKFLKNLDVDVVTSGNHIFKKYEVLDYIDNEKTLLKPININSYTPGNGTVILNKKGKKIQVTNIMGRVYMDNCDNPYPMFEKILEESNADIHLVDFHAEATAEKIAFAWNFDGKINALAGTHTHVQTADERILPKGTAFISDIGMCGPINSIIGVNPEEVIKNQKTGLLQKFNPAIGPSIFSAIVITIDNKNNRTQSIERILLKD